MEKHSVKSFIELTMEFRREGDLWTGVCKELGTAADAETFEEAVEVLHEMVILHLNTLQDVGECNRVLEERGIVIHRIEHPKPTPIPVSFDSNQFINRQLIPLGNC